MTNNIILWSHPKYHTNPAAVSCENSPGRLCAHPSPHSLTPKHGLSVHSGCWELKTKYDTQRIHFIPVLVYSLITFYGFNFRQRFLKSCLISVGLPHRISLETNTIIRWDKYLEMWWIPLKKEIRFEKYFDH